MLPNDHLIPVVPTAFMSHHNITFASQFMVQEMRLNEVTFILNRLCGHIYELEMNISVSKANLVLNFTKNRKRKNGR